MLQDLTGAPLGDLQLPAAAVEHMRGNHEGKYSITANAMAPAGMTRMVGQIPGMDGQEPPPLVVDA